MRRLHVLRKQRVLRVSTDGYPVVGLVAVVSGRRIYCIVYRLATVDTDSVSFLIAPETLEPQPLPSRAPSRIAHVLTSKQKRAHEGPRCYGLYSAIGMR